MSTDRSTNGSGGMNRRSALKILGALPLAAALPDVAAAAATAPAAPAAPVTDAPASLAPTAPKFFTTHEMATVRVLSDLVIPRDERSGSATDAKVPEFMDYMLAHDASERTQVEMRGGLAWMDAQSRKRFGTEFIHASHAQQTAILDDIAWPEKTRPELSQGAAFFSTFRDYVASGFFSSAMGHQDVHYIGNVFNPNWHGCGDEAMHSLGVTFDVMKERR
jgi:gluconate 2-dehydrogenase gamma chain